MATLAKGSHFRYGTIEWEWVNKDANGKPLTSNTVDNILEVTVSSAWRIGFFLASGAGKVCDEFSVGGSLTLDYGGLRGSEQVGNSGNTIKMLCNGNMVQGNHVQEIGNTADYDDVTLARAKFRKPMKNIAGTNFLLKASGNARINALKNAGNQRYAFTSQVTSDVPFSPSASSFPQLYVSTQTSAAEINVAASVQKWVAASSRFQAESFAQGALELSWTTGSDWVDGGSANNADSYGMTIPDKTKGTIRWDTTLVAVGGLYCMSLTVSEIDTTTKLPTGAYTLLDIIVEVLVKPPNFCSIGCKVQSEGGTGGITCGKNSDCYSTKAQFDAGAGPNSKCQWDSSLDAGLWCDNCHGPDSANTQKAPHACIENRPAKLTIEHPSCDPAMSSCSITALANVELTFYVVGTDEFPDDNAAVGVTGLPASAVLVSSTTTNPTRRLFRWTPSKSDPGGSVLFSAQSTGESMTTMSLLLNIDPTAYPIYITGILRDFKLDHPDMESVGATGRVPNRFNNELNDAFAAVGTKASYDQWFKDTAGINLGRAHTIILKPDGADRWKTETCSPTGTPSDWGREKCTNPFYPLDGTMFGNEGMNHN